jgi:ribulose-phosphate 3-epimerase
MVEIIPSILVDTSEKFTELVSKYKPYFQRVSLDISDGIFTPAKTIDGLQEVNQDTSDLKFDVHMMITSPQDKIEAWLKTKADRFFIHFEGNQAYLEDIINKIKLANKKFGLVINPETDLGQVTAFLDKIDYLQFMTIHPGFYGRQFMPEVLDKISNFKNNYSEIPIAVDGGINLETAQKVVGAGASILIVGSYFLTSQDLSKSLTDLKSILGL